MDGMGFIMSAIVGGLAGWIAEKVMKFDTGLLANVGLGLVGGMLGNFLLGLVGVGLGGLVGQLITAVAGACVLVFGYRALKGRSA